VLLVAARFEPRFPSKSICTPVLGRNAAAPVEDGGSSILATSEVDNMLHADRGNNASNGSSSSGDDNQDATVGAALCATSSGGKVRVTIDVDSSGVDNGDFLTMGSVSLGGGGLAIGDGGNNFRAGVGVVTRTQAESTPSVLPAHPSWFNRSQ
jgi:hypothetical protein